MNLSRNNFGHRRVNPLKGQESKPLTNRTNIDYRNSAINQYRINIDHETSSNYNRYSFDHEPQSINCKKEQVKPNVKPTSYQNIRNTLTQLKKKIETAKEELQGNRILGKNIIFQQPDDEQSRTFELVSFNGSSGSNKLAGSSLDQTKRSFLQKLRKYEFSDISHIKGYYKAEVAKGLKQGGGQILTHITNNWRVLRSSGGLSQPSHENLISKKHNIATQRTGKRTIVFGLDGTLVYVDLQKKGQDDIDVLFQLQNNQFKQAYLCLRPYAMTFLKKMSKQYEIIIFSDRNRSETDAILEILDPFKEIIKNCLCKQNCIQIKNGVWTKDLRIIERDIQQILLIDNQPYSYLFQIDNAVPIISFHRGNDDQLYSLQKYLLEAVRTPNLRKFNKEYFQLYKYKQFVDALQAVRNIYMDRK